VKKIIAVSFAVLIILAFAVPVFAQSMTHNVTYRMSGKIDLEKQVGHLCNTGGQMKQTIKGEGEMTKVMNTSQVKGKLTVSDEQDWVTAEDATRNLTVTSVIELCAPAKSEVTSTDRAYGSEGWGSHSTESILSPQQWYDVAQLNQRGDVWERNGSFYGSRDAMLADSQGISVARLRAQNSPEQLDQIYRELAENGYRRHKVEPLTDQVWAVQVSPDPGFSGTLTQDFEAAYGPYEGVLTDGPGADFLGPETDHTIHRDGFGFRTDNDGYRVIVTGDDYVGNYFNIDQFARTSQGTTRRYIDISSPWSHAYLYEDMEVVGMAEIEESFAMDNLAPGAEAIADWWDLF